MRRKFRYIVLYRTRLNARDCGEQLETKGYTDVDLKTVPHTKRIEIMRAKKGDEEIRKLLAAGTGKDGLGFMDTAAAAKIGINEGQATAEIRCLLR